jgi:hypothetical protein
VGALLVVVLAERVELALQLGKVGGGCSGAEPALQRLVEAFGLALGLGMPGGSVLLADTEQREHVFEGVAPAGEPGCVDAAVIGQRALRRAVFLHVAKQYGHHTIAGHGLMGSAGEQEAGVVIEPVEDLHLGPVSQPPVDEVRLPHLIGLGHLEPRIGRSRPLARLRADQPGPVEDPVDRRRGGRLVALPFQMPSDRHGTAVEAVRDQLRSQLEHPLANG